MIRILSTKAKEYLIRSQVSSSAVNLLDTESTCVFSLMGHDAHSYMPKNVIYGEDYVFLYFLQPIYRNCCRIRRYSYVVKL